MHKKKLLQLSFNASNFYLHLPQYYNFYHVLYNLHLYATSSIFFYPIFFKYHKWHYFNSYLIYMCRMFLELLHDHGFMCSPHISIAKHNGIDNNMRIVVDIRMLRHFQKNFNIFWQTICFYKWRSLFQWQLAFIKFDAL